MISTIVLSAMVMSQPPVLKPPVVMVAPRVEAVKPVDVATEIGVAITLTSEASVRWECCDTTTASSIHPSTDGKSCVFVAAKPGRYLILATAATGPAAKILVTVGGAMPGPVPIPPEPKPPEPPAPPRPDPLIAKFRAAFEADPMQLDKKRTAAENLVAIYSEAAKAIADAPSIAEHSKQVKSVSERMFSDDGLPANSLQNVRNLVLEELKVAFPAGPPSVLTPEVRQTVATIYARAAAAARSLI